MAGRFAPSPTGELHLGNLRTALAAAVAARAGEVGFVIRMEDLDLVTSSHDHERVQLDDLSAVGVRSDIPVVRQSERFDMYRSAIASLTRAGLVYECFCTRREIAAEIDSAVSAPHVHRPDGAYPGTCRDLSSIERERRRGEGRRPALRLRTEGEQIAVDDLLAGRYTALVDDVVLARADGVPAYNLAVVIDDAAQGVTQVVRGDDLLSSTPRQVHLHTLLGLPVPAYLHVPLVLGPDGTRLSKRDGSVTLSRLAERGVDPVMVRDALAGSLGFGALGPVDDPVAIWASQWDPKRIPRQPQAVGELGLGI